MVSISDDRCGPPWTSKGKEQRDFTLKRRVFGLAPWQSFAGFTLVELLIVIGILAVLGTAAVIVINPAELMKQTRDATRVADLQTLNKSLSMYQAEGGSSFGAANTVYLSLPDSNANCSSYTLPSLPGGWNYACKPAAIYRNTDGSGWLPVNLASISSGSPLATLPVDPVNDATTGNYYTYIGGSWELTALFESTQKTVNASTDGGVFPGVFEVGPDLTLGPFNRDSGLLAYWRMNEGAGSSTLDELHHYSLALSGSWDTGIEGNAYNVLGSGWVTTTFPQAIGTVGTYVFWFRLPDTSDTSGTFLCTEDATNTSIEDNFSQTSYGDWVCSGFGGSKQSSSMNVSDTNWHLFAMTKSSDALLCKDDTCTSVGDTTLNSLNLKKLVFNGGCGCGNSNFSQGIIIDEIRIYSKVLSADEIGSIYMAR